MSKVQKPSRSTLKDLKERAESGYECLDLIREKLVGLGLDMDGCPPMFYPEAIHTLYARTARAAAECQKEHDSHKGDKQAWSACIHSKVLAQRKNSP